MKIDWLDPWWATDDFDEEFHATFKQELESEVGSEHPLFGIETRLIARGDGDDALFELQDGTGRYAVVHLTWANRPERIPWPATEIFSSFESFVSERMIPDHQQAEQFRYE